MAQVNIRIPDTDKAKLDKLADRQGITVSDLIRDILKRDAERAKFADQIGNLERRLTREIERLGDRFHRRPVELPELDFFDDTPNPNPLDALETLSQSIRAPQPQPEKPPYRPKARETWSDEDFDDILELDTDPDPEPEPEPEPPPKPKPEPIYKYTPPKPRPHRTRAVEVVLRPTGELALFVVLASAIAGFALVVSMQMTGMLERKLPACTEPVPAFLQPIREVPEPIIPPSVIPSGPGEEIVIGIPTRDIPEPIMGPPLSETPTRYRPEDDL